MDVLCEVSSHGMFHSETIQPLPYNCTWFDRDNRVVWFHPIESSFHGRDIHLREQPIQSNHDHPRLAVSWTIKRYCSVSFIRIKRHQRSYRAWSLLIYSLMFHNRTISVGRWQYQLDWSAERFPLEVEDEEEELELRREGMNREGERGKGLTRLRHILLKRL